MPGNIDLEKHLNKHGMRLFILHKKSSLTHYIKLMYLYPCQVKQKQALVASNLRGITCQTGMVKRGVFHGFLRSFHEKMP